MIRRLATLLAALAAALAMAAPVVAHDGDDGSMPRAHIDLPAGWAPEGITAGRGDIAYVGSLADGAIAKVDLETGAVSVLAAGTAGRVTVGVDFERRAGRIWAAGGPTGEIRAYDSRTGALLATYPVSAGFLNDVVVTRSAVYVTDSFVQQLIVIPLHRDGSLPSPSEAFALPLTGDIAFGSGFNANGIVATHHSLIVVQSSTGLLFRVNPRTGVATTIDLGGATVTAGDGLELHGKRLFVVRNTGRVDVVKLRRHATAGRVEQTLTSPELDTPTTGAWSGGRLWVVNARFGVPPAPDTAYWLTALRR